MSGSSKDPLLVERAGALTTLTLNRPEKLNALNAVLVEAMIEAVEHAAHEEVRLVVIRGNGKGFSAGFDLSQLDEQSDADLSFRFIRIEMLLQAILGAPFVTLALVHGPCMGAAADLVAACTHRVASREATFRMPGLQFGVVLGTRRLASLVGAHPARDMLQAAKLVDAQTAMNIGFLTALHESGEWPNVVSSAQQAAETLSLSALRNLLAESASRSDDADLAALVRSVSQPGLQARIKAYLGKSDAAVRLRVSA